MGQSKHRISGRVPVNTRAKVLRAIEENKRIKAMGKKPPHEMVGSVRELMDRR